MKDVSPSCSKTDSPKTPGGISKSLLTPCRRVGLSRKWKKGGGSPFISPISTHNSTAEIKDSRETTKRKKGDKSEFCDEANETPIQQHNVSESTPEAYRSTSMSSSITTTPCRNIQILRTKSKTLSLSLNVGQDKDVSNGQENNKNDLTYKYSIGEIKCKENTDVAVENKKSSKKSMNIVNKNDATEEVVPNNLKQTSQEHVAKIVKTESKSKHKLSLKRSNSKGNSNIEKQNSLITSENCNEKEKSPNNLTKECIVVIQNKIFKPNSSNTKANKITIDSDSEPDVPLSELRKESTENITLNTLNDDDFISTPPKKKFRKLSIIKPAQHIGTSQGFQDDGKNTILIKKTYEKVMKPQKAKSTGSITQKDIDDMRARIEMKKKLLMAKAMSIDTEELRELIKRWQKGCQDALMELLDLMKKKLPDRQNMGYAEMLETLKIPAELVGYNPENDCFLTPDDNNILLTAFKL